MSLTLKFAASSDIGLVRKMNQDSGFASENILVLADGMGGAAAGDTASAVAVAHLKKLDYQYPLAELLPNLRASLNNAHQDLILRAIENPEMKGMGTTCIALLRSADKIAMVHIGDSRAYLLRKSRLTQVTHDHTLVQMLVDTGQITAEEAASHPKRNMITRALGDNPEPLELDESIREAVLGDRWLLCSDGLFGVVSEENIAHILNSNPDLEECAQELIGLALAGGAPDNVTVVLADVVDSAAIKASEAITVGAAKTRNLEPRYRIDDVAQEESFETETANTGTTSLNISATSEDAEHENNIKDSSEVAPTRSRPLAKIMATLGILAVLVGGVLAGYSWTQTRYYVTPLNGKVAIYQGVPQTLGPLSFHKLHSVTDLEVSDLSNFVQDRLANPITRGSLAEAEAVVENLREHIVSVEIETESQNSTTDSNTNDTGTNSSTTETESSTP
ncbi:MAG: Stp1/IreP family PP2C-type Ser/Thr phosphatase [Arcanobacterium sp.]|nr:Stp1/IreP family PP2C-type Ser/Thr phosphatase [Arcanobacterium sp.]